MTVVVDAANVIGARPDGWWRDRAGAAERLHADLVRIADRPVPGDGEVPRYVLVLEGAARAARIGSCCDHVVAVRAAASGDDAIVDVVRELTGTVVVVTADRELRRRCAELGAAAVGPRWLLARFLS